MPTCQPAILQPVPVVARHLLFDLTDPAPSTAVLKQALSQVAALADGERVVVGIGPAVVAGIGAHVPGLRGLPELSGPGAQVPSTPFALWCWLRGDDPGVLLHLTRRVCQALAPALRVRHVVDGFRHALGESGHGKDLTGYEDGTENPTGDDAVEAAIVRGQGEGLDGSSFAALQQWTHDFDTFEALAEADRDHHFGRRLSDNEEIEDSPTWAHVKRTAQESFDPPAFMLRRSMPWMAGMEAGLMFLAFGCTLDAFERQMRRMAGLEDGVVDAMFRISKPVNGAYFWCPPVRDGRLDLRQLGL